MPFSLLLIALLTAGTPDQVSLEQARPTFADAVQLANDGHESEALAAFQRLVSANPNDLEARLWIARLHERMNHPSLAEAVYRSVLLEDGENVEAMLGVASTLLARDEPDEAIEMLEGALALAPQSDVVVAALGRAHRDAGSTFRAIAYLERAVELSPTEQHRLSLESARLSYLHHVETRGFSEEYNGNTPDTRAGDVAVSIRLSDTLRVNGRGQVQRKFGIQEERGGGGVEWRWARRVALRGQALIAPDAAVIPEGDFLGELDYMYRRTTWSAGVRYFDFTGAWVTVMSPSVTWPVSDRVSLGLRYALAITQTNTLDSRQRGHSVQLRGAYRWYPRLSLLAGYAGGVEDFDTFSIDRIGDFRANSVSGGARYELPTLTSLLGQYEHQWRERGINMGRVTVSIAQRF